MNLYRIAGAGNRVLDSSGMAEGELLRLGAKFSPGGAHISRTMMLDELRLLLDAVPFGSASEAYRTAILDGNVLGKSTGSTREKSLRHLRELYALDEGVPLFHVVRKLHANDRDALPLLALLCAWCRDPLLRATTPAVVPAPEGSEVFKQSLMDALAEAFPDQYSDLNQDKIARNAASSWTQSGHLSGRTKKIRTRVRATVGPVAMALWLGHAGGIHGKANFTSPWCRLLDLSADQARARAADAHRQGLITMRAIGEVVELRFEGFPTPETSHK